jgi:hypothetical protein
MGFGDATLSPPTHVLCAAGIEMSGFLLLTDAASLEATSASAVLSSRDTSLVQFVTVAT